MTAPAALSAACPPRLTPHAPALSAPPEPAASDRRGFEAECLPHRQALYAAALRMTREPADAHDLVQETLLRALTAWHRFEAGSNSRAWLMRILTNSYINIYRKRVRHRRIRSACPSDTVAAAHAHRGQHARSPEESLVDDQLGDEVERALAGLGSGYRQVIEMADLRGLCYRDIAAALDVPIGTVMSRLFRARRRLEAELSSFAARDYGIRRAA